MASCASIVYSPFVARRKRIRRWRRSCKAAERSHGWRVSRHETCVAWRVGAGMGRMGRPAGQPARGLTFRGRRRRRQQMHAACQSYSRPRPWGAQGQGVAWSDGSQLATRPGPARLDAWMHCMQCSDVKSGWVRCIFRGLDLARVLRNTILCASARGKAKQSQGVKSVGSLQGAAGAGRLAGKRARVQSLGCASLPFTARCARDVPLSWPCWLVHRHPAASTFRHYLPTTIHCCTPQKFIFDTYTNQKTRPRHGLPPPHFHLLSHHAPHHPHPLHASKQSITQLVNTLAAHTPPHSPPPQHTHTHDHTRRAPITGFHFPPSYHYAPIPGGEQVSPDFAPRHVLDHHHQHDTTELVSTTLHS